MSLRSSDIVAKFSQKWSAVFSVVYEEQKRVLCLWLAESETFIECTI